MDEKGNVAVDLKITSWVVLPKEKLIRKELGTIERQRLTISKDALSQLKLLNKVSEIVACYFCFAKS